jgi:hypothetical protein
VDYEPSLSDDAQLEGTRRRMSNNRDGRPGTWASRV